MVRPARPSRVPALRTLTVTCVGVDLLARRRTARRRRSAGRPRSGNGSVTARPAPGDADDAAARRARDSVAATGTCSRCAAHQPVHHVHPGVQHVALLQGGAQRAVQAVLEVELALPLDDVGEQVAVERRVLVEQRGELQGVLGGDQLVEPDLARRQRRPVARASARGRGRAVPSPTRLKITRRL